MPSRRTVLLSLGGLACGLLAARAPAGAAGDLRSRFGRSADGSSATVDHAAWSALLASYVKPGADGLNRVDYRAWKAQARPALEAYIARLEEADPVTLARPEQIAFWANLYNARTIAIVLEHYPVRSIKDINLGGTLLASLTGGPWKAKLLEVGGVALSLDDVEHEILRPVFRDARIHYAVNCASIGCPNLGRAALAGPSLERDLDAAASAYVNSPRGVRIESGRLTASSIYSWFAADFGGEAGVLEHLRRYAEPALKEALARFDRIDAYAYDWGLNEVAA